MALAGWLVLAQGAPSARAEAPEITVAGLPVATDARLEALPDGARLTMTLSRPFPVETSVHAGPDRVIVDLPSVNFQMPAPKHGRVGPVASYRYGLFTPERARIVIDLAQPALVVKAEARPVRGGFGELVIELKRAPREAFEAAARLPAPSVVPPAPVDAAAARPPGETRRIVVIDPGHGGIDPGATVAEVAEKEVVLAFGHALRQRLEATGRYRVAMTRDDDRFVALAERVRIARVAGADLFISIHADSLTRGQGVRGATVYTGSERATDAEAARLAAKENQADAVAGLESADDVQDVAGILMDLAKRETRTFSTVFARNLVERLGGAVKLHKVPLRSAGFRVLGAPDVPSVLLELGYMSSPRDAELMTSPEWRGQAAAAVGEAIDAYFERERDAGPGKAAANRR